jgi:uncharacterized protein (DUF2132 family)
VGKKVDVTNDAVEAVFVSLLRRMNGQSLDDFTIMYNGVEYVIKVYPKQVSQSKEAYCHGVESIS